MRALLVLIVLLAWAACLLGAVGLPVFLALTASGALRHQAGPDRRNLSPPSGAAKALVVYAVAMAAVAGTLAGLVLWGREPAPASSAIAWAALPLWSAFCATVAAILLRRRRRATAQELHTT